MASATPALRKPPLRQGEGAESGIDPAYLREMWEMVDKKPGRDLKPWERAYAQIPNKLLEAPGKKFSYRRFVVVLKILQKSKCIGEEWVHIPLREFLDASNCRSKSGMCRELEVLKKQGIVEQAGTSARPTYRIVLKKYRDIEDLPPRETEDDAEEKPDLVLRTGSATVLSAGKLVRVSYAGVSLPFVNTSPKAAVAIRISETRIEVHAEGTAGENATLQTKGLRENRCTVVQRSADSSPDERCTPVQHGPDRLAELRDALQLPAWVKYFGKSLDEEILRRTERRLGTATVQSFLWHLSERSKRGKRIKPGLLPDLAGESARTAEALNPAAAPPETLASVATAFDPEPLGSASQWARTLALLKRDLSPQAYQNWFATKTRFLSLDGQTLVVAVADEVTRDFLQEEYMQEVAAAVHELGIERIRYEVVR